MSDPLVRIQGAGPVGILAALFLVKYGWDPSAIELVDHTLHTPQPAHDHDPRILALSHGTLVRLAHLHVPVQATRIQHIHVSSQGHFGSMEIHTDRVGVTDLGGLASYASLLTQLRQTVRDSGVALLEAPGTATPGVLVVAEGGVFQRDAPMNDPGMELVRDYHQNAVIGWVTTTPPPTDTAWERFTSDGVVALLPIGQRYALIFCAQTERAEAFRHAAPEEQRRMLSEIMTSRVRGIDNITITGSYPLGLKWRERLADGNTVWIGNSAQALHPVAGQGLNLGFRDAETLSTCLLQRGQSIPDRLQDYARRRRADRWAVRTATDTLARAAWVRRAIGGVALLPGAKKLLGQVLMYGG